MLLAPLPPPPLPPWRRHAPPGRPAIIMLPLLQSLAPTFPFI